MKRLLWLVVLLVNCTVLAGCPSSVPLEARVSQSYNGGAITLKQGQELVVELEAVSPLSWEVVLGANHIFGEPVKKSIQTQQSTLERYVFTALFVGNGQLRLEELHYGGAGNATPEHRPRVFTLNVTVTK